MRKNPVVFIVAGEASGDIHGANLIKTIAQAAPNLHFYAMGHQQLAKAGAQLIVDAKHLAIVGFVEVITKLKQILQAFRQLKQAILQHQPELIILIDYPGFNLRLAKKIKKISPQTKIIYYISPQIWAWRYNRIKILKKHIDLMAVIFPFEVALYLKENVPVVFVGHPLIEQIKLSLPRAQTRCFFSLRKSSLVIGLMPGSRLSEIKNILPTMLASAAVLQQKYQDIEFILPLAPTLTLHDLHPYLKNIPFKVKIIDEKHYDAINICDALMVTSGTATLEVTLLKKPMVIIYKTSFLSFAIGKYLVKVPHVGLCNILAGEEIIKEFLQEKATPQNIASEIMHILSDKKYQAQMTKKLQEISLHLSQQDFSVGLAPLVLKMLSAQSVTNDLALTKLI